MSFGGCSVPGAEGACGGGGGGGGGPREEAALAEVIGR